jgi:hypothetical protein
MRSRRFAFLGMFAVVLVLNLLISAWWLSGNTFQRVWASPLNQEVEPAAIDIANIPNAFSYQGTLRRADGNLANGAFNIKLNFYAGVTGGSPLHSETFNNVVVRNGNFSVVVGDAVAVPAGLFDNATLYLGLTVAPDGEMLPRQRLFPVPWAMQAGASKTATSATTANQLLNNTATNLILNRGATDTAALAINSSAATYGAGMTMSNSTGSATYGMYVGSDGNWHFANTGSSQEVLYFNKADGNAVFAKRVYSPLFVGKFNGQCFTWPLVVYEFTQIYCNQDVAETFATDVRSEPGDLMTLIPEDRAKPTVRLATQGDTGPLIGIVSTNPGLVFDEGKSYFAGDNSNLITDHKTAVAMLGRVPVKFSLENGPIAVGDPLTISSSPGVAMKATEAGPIVGYAMQSSDAAQDGKLLVWLQVGMYLPPATLDALNHGAANDDALNAQIVDLSAQLAALSAQVDQLAGQ